MSLHQGAHWYALCGGGTSDDRCAEFLLPAPSSDPTGRGAIIAGRRDVFAAAEAAGWQPENQPGDPWLCPRHKPAPKAAVPAPEGADTERTNR